VNKEVENIVNGLLYNEPHAGVYYERATDLIFHAVPVTPSSNIYYIHTSEDIAPPVVYAADIKNSLVKNRILFLGEL